MILWLKDKNRRTLSLQYFLYFGVLGVFLPYFNLYCYQLGFDGIQIGTLSALRSIVLVLFSVIWSMIADRFQIRKPIYVLCSFLSASIWGAYFLSEQYWAVFIITGCYGLFYAPIISFLEAFTMDVLGEQKKRYGSIRAWGSIAFISMVTLIGYCINLFSIKIILWAVFLGSIFQSLFSLKMPQITLPRKVEFFSKAKKLTSHSVIIFLLCAFMMLVSHGMYYGFFSIHLSKLGYDSIYIGVAWALASLAEIVVMVNSKWIFKHIAYEKALLFSFGVATVRWVLLGYVTNAVFILLLQTLHAVTYALFHVASILYMDFLSPGETKTLGQAVNNATTYGLGLMAGFFLSGVLYEHLNASAGFVTSGGIAFLSFLVFAVYLAVGLNKKHVGGLMNG